MLRSNAAADTGSSLATLGRLMVLALAILLISLQARQAHGEGPSWIPGFATHETAIPDDTVLLEQLTKSIDLRRRENFDRVLDARDPGELVEHATLTKVDFDHRALGIDTLFIVGDELFGYLFRPENGWGSGGADRKAIDYTPEFRRVH